MSNCTCSNERYLSKQRQTPPTAQAWADPQIADVDRAVELKGGHEEVAETTRSGVDCDSSASSGFSTVTVTHAVAV
jgi:hypothetical protein